LRPAGEGLGFSTERGGGLEDQVQGSAVQAATGAAHLTGVTRSVDFPTRNPLQPAKGGGDDAFVSALTATGDLVYSTYLGGGGNDFGSSIAVDSFGAAHVAGVTDSTDFPAAAAFQATKGADNDAFVSKLDTSEKAPV